MVRRSLVLLRSVALLSWFTILSYGCSATESPRSVADPVSPAEAWTLPRTADGQPDLQGMWTNDTLTPFERPLSLGDREFLTEEEATAIERRASERAERANAHRPASTAPPPAGGSVGGYNQFWIGDRGGVVDSKRTSLVVDPPDGRVPLRPEAAATRAYNLEHRTDSWDHMSVYTRCITRGVPGTMFPALYNNGHQILQTRDYVVILHEMVRHARVIPLDGRPHAPSQIDLWMGDGRGHWDGDTLVVETRNFNDRGWIASNVAAGRIQGIPVSGALEVVERFTRIAEDTIDYQVTVEDPNMYTAPWTASIPLTRDPGYEIFEYACHEGNRAVGNILGGGRAQEEERE